jgi:hypothetical protein
LNLKKGINRNDINLNALTLPFPFLFPLSNRPTLPSLPPAPSSLFSSLSFSHCRLIKNILSLKNSGGMLRPKALLVYIICFQERLASNCIYTLNHTLFHHSGLFHGRLLLQSLLLSGLFHSRFATTAAKTFWFFWFVMLKNDPNRTKLVRFEPILGSVQVILTKNTIFQFG